MARGVSSLDEARLQGRLWTPDLLRPNLSLWLDAADLSSINCLTGASVSEWRDKSGNGLHAATTVRRPSLMRDGGSLSNGLSVIRFTGASFQKLDTPNFSIAPARQYCTFAVVSGAGLISSGSYPRIWVAKGAGDASAGGSTYAEGYLGAGASNGTAAHFAGAASPLVPEISGLSTTAPLILTGLFGTAGLAANTISLAANGGAQTTGSGRTGALSTTGIRIGADVSAGQSPWNSWMGEIILTPALSFAQTQLVEGYLSAKWGIRLVATHPFANRPPLIGD